MEALIYNFFNLEILLKVHPLLLKGFWMTLQLCLLVVPLGIAGGLVVAVAYSFHVRWLNWLLIAYVDFFRSFPPLVLLILVFYGLPFIGLEVPSLVAVLIAFLLNTAATTARYSGPGSRASDGGSARRRARPASPGSRRWCTWSSPGGAQRAPRPHQQHPGSHQVHRPRERRRPAGAASDGAGRAGPHLQPDPLIAVALVYLALLWPIVRLLSRLERRTMAKR